MDPREDQVDYAEDNPLLGPAAPEEEHGGAGDRSGPVRPPKARISNAAWYQASTPTAIVSIVSLFMFFLVLALTLALIPMARIIEDALCRRYYDTPDSVDESRCKIDAVQTELAYIGGISTAIEAVVSLVVSFPWGILSDRIGRIPIFRISYAGLVMSILWSYFIVWNWQVLPIRLVLAGPVFAVIGGGARVNVAVMHSIIADVATDKASAFIWTSLGAVAGGIVGPVMASGMMETLSPWVPMMIPPLILTPAVFLLTFFVPETLSSSAHERGTEGSVDRNESFAKNVRTHLTGTKARLVESMAILKDRSVLLLLPVFALQSPLMDGHTKIIGLYLSRRFGWSLKKMGYLAAARGLITVAVLVALPIVSALLMSPSIKRLHLSAFRKDFVLAHFSFVSLVLGNVLVASQLMPTVISGLVILTMATGLGSMCRSLISNYVDSQHLSRLYTLTGMIETVGSFLGGPTLAWMFARGMRIGPAWLGLPFVCLAVHCTLAWGALCFIRQPEYKPVEDDIEARTLDDE